jgi:hypothetical protein
VTFPIGEKGAGEMAATEVRVARARVMFKAPGGQINGLEAVPEGL